MTDIGRGVADPQRDRAILGPEIGRGGLHGGGRADRLRGAQHHPRADEAANARDDGMRHAGQAPHQDARRETDPQAHPVDEPAGAEKRHRGGELERRGHVAVILIGPGEFMFQRRLQQRQDLSIDVVEHDREEHEGYDDPAGTGWTLAR
jgi:hypothetical protein